MNINDYKLYFCADKDDVLVKSSPLIEAQVNSKTQFKTATLKMLEQLNRNCDYYVSKVTAECEMAKIEGRVPNLSQFPNFEMYDWAKVNDMYNGPVLFAKYYKDVANQIFNQFLEERDTFLETDNLPKGQIGKYNYPKEMAMIEYFVDLIYKNKEALKNISDYCVNEIKEIIKDAKRRKVINGKNGKIIIPDYGELVKADTNDIIKTTSLTINSTTGVTPYKKPIEDVQRCLDEIERINDIVRNASVFFTPSNELIDYGSIYRLENVNWDAVKVVRAVMKSGLVGHGFTHTHHNGDRESSNKMRLSKEILPEMGFIGQYFHDSRHDAARRYRSSKIDEVVRRFGIRPEQVVLLDDSKPNCLDCKQKGGNEIYYKQFTDAEILKDQMEIDEENPLRRITEFNEDEVVEIVKGCEEKVKKLILGGK